MNNKRRIASLALFRNLYNEGKSDVMTILCEFAKSIVNDKHLTGFSPTQIKNELKDEYDFYIPEYVVESVLKKFCKKDGAMYYPSADNLSQMVNNQEIEKIEKSHETIISKLISFVEDKKSKKLESKEIERLIQSFCGFLLDESDVDYSDYISAFIIETQGDVELSALLKTIKEGVVLYTGIQYNDNINETGSWKDDYTIYVEQEILFHMAGYNGVLYQQLFQDFMGLVEEINRKAQKQLIKIKFFDSVRFEIESYFNVAERIVDGKETLDCSKIAMTTIVQGCENKSDVIAKKCAFFDLMKKKQITEDDGSAYFKERSEFNIFYDDNLTKLSNDLPDRDVEWSLKLLNYISMIRKGNISGFEKSKCILLTGNTTTMAVAFHPLIKQNGDVPLATTLDYITNRLWFKLNKGFGSNLYPKSFSVVTKAQIVLSTQIVGSVAKEYEKIKKEITEKSKTEDEIIAELAELKTRVRKPEEVVDSIINDVLDTISMADTERYLREREMERQAAEKQIYENMRLQKEIEKKNQEKAELEARKNNQIKQKELENIQLESRLNESKTNEKNRIKEQIEAITKRKEKVDKKVNKRIKRLKWLPFAVIFFVLILVIVGICMYGWDKMEQWTWVLSMIVIITPYLIFGLGFKAWNPKKFISVWYKNRYEKKLYEEYDIDVKKLHQLKEDHNSLR